MLQKVIFLEKEGTVTEDFNFCALSTLYQEFSVITFETGIMLKNM